MSLESFEIGALRNLQLREIKDFKADQAIIKI